MGVAFSLEEAAELLLLEEPDRQKALEKLERDWGSWIAPPSIGTGNRPLTDKSQLAQTHQVTKGTLQNTGAHERVTSSDILSSR